MLKVSDSFDLFLETTSHENLWDIAYKFGNIS